MEQHKTFFEELVHADWMGRNSNDYTYAAGKPSSGWEASLGKGDASSRYLKDLTGIDNVNVYISKCSAMVNMIATTLNGGKPLKVSLVKEFNSYTDLKEIVVTSEPLYVNDANYFPTLNHRLDPVLGYTIHEMAHVLYTEPEYETYLRQFEKNPAEFKIRASLMNLLEDERIENLIAQNFGGYVSYLGRSKDYCFGYKFSKEKEKIDMTHELTALMNTIINLIRYPKSLDEASINKFEPEVREIMAILKEFPKTTKELSDAVDKIFMVLKKYFKKQEEEQQQPQQGDPIVINVKVSGQGQPQPQQEQEKQEGGGTSEEPDDQEISSGSGGQKTDKESDQEADENSGDGQSEGEAEKEQENEENEAQNGSGDNEEGDEDGEQDGAGNEGGSNDGQEMTEEMSKELGEKVSSALEELLDALSNSDAGMPDSLTQLAKELNRSQPCGDSRTEGKSLKMILNATSEEKEQRDGKASTYKCLESLAVNRLQVYIQDPKDLTKLTNRYEESLAVVGTYAGALRAKLSELNRKEQVVNRNLFEGDFDSDSLVDALIGVKNIYSETYDVTNRGAVIALLIDESYSMGDNGKYHRARELAILFERALEGVNNIDFYCYGHTTATDDAYYDGSREDSTVLIPYFEGRGKGDRKNLGKIHFHGANRDGHAIAESVARIRKDVPLEKKIIMFVVSDGMPSASIPSGMGDKVEYTKKCVDTVKKDMNTDCIHLALDKNGKSEEMFEKYVKFEGNYSIVVQTIGQLLQKILLDNQQDLIKL